MIIKIQKMEKMIQKIASETIKIFALLFIVFFVGFKSHVYAQPASPANVTATPNSVTCGNSISLNATTSGSNVIVRWWDAAAVGNMIGSSVSGANLSFLPSVTMPVYAEAFDLNTSLASLSRISVNITVSSGTLSPPASVTANPATVLCGNSTNLSASVSSGTILWWDAPYGGNLLGASQNGTSLTITPSAASTYYAQSAISTSGSQTFSYTGSIVNWTVPPGITSINITAAGASGGTYSSIGGRGAIMSGSFAVTPGTVLSILAGQCPGSTTLLPAGGGGTFVALGASYATATPLIVGGGGGGGYTSPGIDAPTSQAGTYTTTSYLGANGYGAVAAPCVGGGGGFYSSGAADTYFTFPGGGGFQQGGAGGCASSSYLSNYQCGGFGGGTAADYVGSCNTDGGSGGGYSGGSGMSTGSKFYGEAGGSYNGGTNQNNLSGSSGNTGNGYVIISWAGSGCVSTRVSVSISVSGVPSLSSVTTSPSVINCGSSLNLSANSTGSIIRWWNVSTGGTLIGTSANGAYFNVSPLSSSVYFAEAYLNPCVSARIGDTITVNPLPPPSLVAAFPSIVSCGSSTNLFANTNQVLFAGGMLLQEEIYLVRLQMDFLNIVPSISYNILCRGLYIKFRFANIQLQLVYHKHLPYLQELLH